ncbi:MAG: HNH endonuclease, partial [Lachnospiraceae bacterium]|nr:HNH endonuclease [Lachnospiraceae bacterium]
RGRQWEVIAMPYVLTNGKFFIQTSETGRILKTPSINDADVFPNIDRARAPFNKAKVKTKGYYIKDVQSGEIFKKQKSKIHRKTYPAEVRKMIYNANGGKCYLCGKRIKFEDMTLDHVKPLAMGGMDTLENLACACFACNQFKGNILPDDFHNRITEIFLYQNDTRQRGKIRWRIARKLLISLVENEKRNL